MPSKEMAEQHLRGADKRIARAEKTIARQRKILAKLESNGQEAKYARDARLTLDIMLNTLEAMRSNRNLILDELNNNQGKTTNPSTKQHRSSNLKRTRRKGS